MLLPIVYLTYYYFCTFKQYVSKCIIFSPFEINYFHIGYKHYQNMLTPMLTSTVGRNKVYANKNGKVLSCSYVTRLRSADRK